MQIRPIFPPKEDVQVGDIFLLEKVGETDANGYCVRSSASGDFLPLPIHVGYLPDVMKTANAYYASRPDFPRSGTATGTVSFTATTGTITFAPISTDVTSGTDTLFVSGRANRSRLVGFPDFMSVKIDKVSLGAILPIQGVFSPIGLSTEDVDSASLSIPVAESYGVPAAAAWEAMGKAPAQMAALCSLGSALSKPETGQGERAAAYHLVTEVFYTRAIDVNLQGRSSTSFGLARDRANQATVSVPSVTSTAVVTPTSSLPSQATTTVQSINAVVDGVKAALAARNSIPGVTLAVESGRSNTISMRRVFDRPVAIGYRAVGLKAVRRGDGCELQIAPPATSTAPATTDGQIQLPPVTR